MIKVFTTATTTTATFSTTIPYTTVKLPYAHRTPTPLQHLLSILF